MLTAQDVCGHPSPGILIIDDDEVFCDVLERALRRRGFDVYAAYDARNGLELARAHLPEYAVVDLRLGHDSGLALVEQLAAVRQGLRILMLTGYASIATAVEAVKLGAIHYLSKPTNADEIVAALHRDDGDVTVSPSRQPLSVKRLEWEHLQKVLAECDGNISAAARALRMHRRTLQRKLKKRPVRR